MPKSFKTYITERFPFQLGPLTAHEMVDALSEYLADTDPARFSPFGGKPAEHRETVNTGERTGVILHATMAAEMVDNAKKELDGPRSPATAKARSYLNDAGVYLQRLLNGLEAP